MKPPTAIAQMIDELIEREGGFVDHPSDRGGPTCWGITEAVARAAGYTGPMKSMPRLIAQEIYAERYWRQPRFDLVWPLSPSIARELFDTGVNMGVVRAATFLQRSLNVLNKRAHLWPDLEVDGMFGMLSRHALQAFIENRGHDGVPILLQMLNSLQGVRYIELAENDESQEDFEFGWQRRVNQ